MSRKRICRSDPQPDCDRHLDCIHTILKRQRFLPHKKVVGGIIDRRSGHKREDAADQKEERRRFPLYRQTARQHRQNRARREGPDDRRLISCHDRQIHAPADCPADTTIQPILLRNSKQRRKGGSSDTGRQKLPQNFPCHFHQSIPPIANIQNRSATPTPIAIQPAVKKASTKRIRPDK